MNLKWNLVFVCPKCKKISQSVSVIYDIRVIGEFKLGNFMNDPYLENFVMPNPEISEFKEGVVTCPHCKGKMKGKLNDFVVVLDGDLKPQFIPGYGMYWIGHREEIKGIIKENLKELEAKNSVE